ncbi:hypothetical protein VCV18_006179 [Metarhizium anisopliae]
MNPFLTSSTTRPNWRNGVVGMLAGVFSTTLTYHDLVIVKSMFSIIVSSVPGTARHHWGQGYHEMVVTPYPWWNKLWDKKLLACSDTWVKRGLWHLAMRATGERHLSANANNAGGGLDYAD